MTRPPHAHPIPRDQAHPIEVVGTRWDLLLFVAGLLLVPFLLVLLAPQGVR